MTSAQTMLGFVFFGSVRLWSVTAVVAAAVVVLMPLLLGGCGSGRSVELRPPHLLVAPYDTVNGEVLWAVVPPVNESGAGFPEPMSVGDKVVAAAAQVRGIRVLPLNRTIAAMRALEMDRVENPMQARGLATALGVDAIVIPSITAYDPYEPPVLGLTLALFGRPGPIDAPSGDLFDTRLFAMQATDGRMDPGRSWENPAAVSSVHLDAQTHDVLMDVRRYAEGRTEMVSARGWKSYIASMDLYTEFVAHEAVGELLDQEWLRMARMSRVGTATRRP